MSSPAWMTVRMSLAIPPSVLLAGFAALAGCLNSPPDPSDPDGSVSEGSDHVVVSFFTHGNRHPPVDLSRTGELDWVHWGYGDVNDVNRKADGGELIVDYSLLGSNFEFTTHACCGDFSWSDGVPVESATAVTSGLFIDTDHPSGDGFQISVAADETMRRLFLYAGGWCARFRLEAVLVGTDALFGDTDFDIPSTTAETVTYQIDFRRGSGTGELLVSFTMLENYCTTDDVGEIWLYGAALQ